MDKIAKIKRQIKAKGLDALWITQPENRRYLSGFTGSAGWLLIPAAGKPILYTDGRYTEQASSETRGFVIHITQVNPIKEMAQAILGHRIKQLGFEDDDVSVSAWKQLKAAVPGIAGKSVQGWVEKHRAIKSPEEIQKLELAISVAEKAFERVLPKVKAGAQERVLAFELEKAMFEGGAEGLAFPLIVASGPHASMPHASVTERRLRPGDLVVMDFGCRIKGYHSDLTRTVAVGKVTSKQREIYKMVKKSQKTSQKLFVSGQKASISDQKSRQTLKEGGLEKYFVHGLGHGIGLQVHELPRISGMSKDVFADNMVVTCEPGVYIPGWGGVRIEDDVLIHQARPQWLSHSSEELRIAGRS